MLLFQSLLAQDENGVDKEICGLRYGEFIPLAIYEIQALKQKIKTLETEINELKGE